MNEPLLCMNALFICLAWLINGAKYSTRENKGITTIEKTLIEKTTKVKYTYMQR
jgi:hypothetical protein